jgi:competence ComEA-like helix-hairpin-helix protein
MPRAASLCVLALAAVALAPAAAGAAGPRRVRGAFGIGPPKVQVTAKPVTRLAPTLVYNLTGDPVEVRISVAPLRQLLDGTYDLDVDRASLLAAKSTLFVDPAPFRLPVGTARHVRAVWQALEHGRDGAYMGVIYQATPLLAGGRSVNTISRLVQLDFLRRAGAQPPVGHFTQMPATQGPRRTLVFTPRVKNAGRIDGTPTGTTFRIRDASGKLVLRKRWKGDTVLPGAQRDFPITVHKLLPAGHYQAVAAMTFGRTKRTKIVTRFTLAGPNTLPTRHLKFGTLTADGVIGSSATVRAQVVNDGTAPSPVRVKVKLYGVVRDFRAPKPSAVAIVDSPVLPVGARRSVEIRLGRHLPPGRFFVDAALSDGKTRFDERSIAGIAHPPAKSRLWLVLGMGAGVLVLLLLAWYLLRRRRRRARRAAGEEPGPEAAAGAVPLEPSPEQAAASNGRVNLNTATAHELETLPGIGPKAAERIVEHRDEYGRFEDVDDLMNVKGFGEARVAALRDRAGV